MAEPGIGAGRIQAADEDAGVEHRTVDLGAFGLVGLGSARPAGLSLRMSAPGEFRIGICGLDGIAFYELGPFADDEIVGRWKALSAASGLPFVVSPADEAAVCGAAAAPLLNAERRKRLVVLGGRRPRFLTRRRTARLPQRPLVHREPALANGRDR